MNVNVPQFGMNYPMAYPQNPYINNAAQGQKQPIIYGMNWVNGIEGAKGAQMLSNSNAVLFDSEKNRVYIKSSDNIGMSTLRIFDLTEITETEQTTNSIDLSQYVTKKELVEEINKLMGGHTNESISANEQTPKSKSK